MRARITCVVVLMLGLLVAVVPSIAGAAPDQQEWHLLGDAYGGTVANDGSVHYKDVVMEKIEVGSGYAMCPPNKTIWWYAENAAETGLSFGGTGGPGNVR